MDSRYAPDHLTTGPTTTTGGLLTSLVGRGQQAMRSVTTAPLRSRWPLGHDQRALTQMAGDPTNFGHSCRFCGSRTAQKAGGATEVAGSAALRAVDLWRALADAPSTLALEGLDCGGND